MHLNSAGASSGAGNDTHIASVRPWTTAAGVAGDLTRVTDSTVKDLGHAHEGMKEASAQLASASALSAVIATWETRLRAVREECKKLESDLKKVGIGFGENEITAKGSFGSVRNRFGIDGHAGER